MNKENQVTWMLQAIKTAKGSTCLKRQVGAVIVKDNQLIARGYNSSPPGVKGCNVKGYCIRAKSQSGKDLDNCYAVHAEMNAITECAKMGISLAGATMYVTHYPCIHCLKNIIASGITTIVYDEYYPQEQIAKDIIEQSGVKLICLGEEPLII